MADRTTNERGADFLGTGWSFPPEFSREAGGVRMAHAERDIEESLRILFGTGAGERVFDPKFGLDLHALQFETMSTTMRTILNERIRAAILIYEPRIDPLKVEVVTDPEGGALHVLLEYVVRATNSRFNLVYPFYEDDGAEARPVPR